MDQWLLAVTSDPAAKGSAKDLEVAGAGPVHCHFPLPPSFLTMCSSENRWILHCVDHWSKFNFAFALPRKNAASVAAALNSYLFTYFGVPQILPSDNGREFVNSVIEGLLAIWHWDIQLVSGRPRLQQSQGLVERAHLTLEKKLASEISKNNSKNPPWSAWLPRLIC